MPITASANHAMSRNAVYLAPAYTTGEAYAAGARHTSGNALVKVDASGMADVFLRPYCFTTGVGAASSTRAARRPLLVRFRPFPGSPGTR